MFYIPIINTISVEIFVNLLIKLKNAKYVKIKNLEEKGKIMYLLSKLFCTIVFYIRL